MANFIFLSVLNDHFLNSVHHSEEQANDIKLIKNLFGKNCFNNEVMKISTSQNGQNKMKMRKLYFCGISWSCFMHSTY